MQKITGKSPLIISPWRSKHSMFGIMRKILGFTDLFVRREIVSLLNFQAPGRLVWDVVWVVEEVGVAWETMSRWCPSRN